MKRTSKTARAKHLRRAVPAPSGGGASALVGGLPDEPDTAGADQAQRVDSGALRDPAQTDIERANEHKAGSVEGVPHTDAGAGLASFAEPAQTGMSGPGTAPFVNEN
jgi:hypothetical protein